MCFFASEYVYQLFIKFLNCAGRNLAVCVGNSQPALLSWLMEQPQTPRVIYTDEHLARGILEGLARHGLY